MTNGDRTYHVPALTPAEWEEMESLPCSPCGEMKYGLIREEWMCVRQMLLGKALLVRAGMYGQGFAEDDAEECEDWAQEIETIADKIGEEFKPGDGKI